MLRVRGPSGGLAPVTTVTADLDIYRTAAIIVKEHGEDAATHAAMRADELIEAGNTEGRTVWLRVLAAVKDLMTTEPEGPLH